MKNALLRLFVFAILLTLIPQASSMERNLKQEQENISPNPVMNEKVKNQLTALFDKCVNAINKIGYYMQNNNPNARLALVVTQELTASIYDILHGKSQENKDMQANKTEASGEQDFRSYLLSFIQELKSAQSEFKTDLEDPILNNDKSIIEQALKELKIAIDKLIEGYSM